MSQEQVTDSQEQAVKPKRRGRKPNKPVGVIDQPLSNNISNEDLPVNSNQKKYKEKYYRVKFHPKSHPNDTESVPLTVNGETLNIKRGVAIILPGRFKECADHTVWPKFSREPGEDLKVVSWVKTYGYDLLGDSNEEEYFAEKTKNDKTTRDHWAREANMIP